VCFGVLANDKMAPLKLIQKDLGHYTKLAQLGNLVWPYRYWQKGIGVSRNERL